MKHVTPEHLLRTMVGFGEHFTNALNADVGYPPFDIETVGEDKLIITLATAGFTPADLAVELGGRVLSIRGKQEAAEDKASRTYLHKGIARREFVRKFTLAEGWEVENAHYADGILTVKLKKNVPERPKVQTIEIGH